VGRYSSVSWGDSGYTSALIDTDLSGHKEGSPDTRHIKRSP
jgi:hypothetical protein